MEANGLRGNYINVPLVAGRTARPMPVWQYDYGIELHFSGATLPEYFQVHFSHTDESGTATTAIGSADSVTIPSTYLQSGETIYAWIFLHTGETDGETVYKIEISVKKRAQPTDEEPTPEEQSEIDELIGALTDGVERAETAADNAATSASAAMDAAEAAEGYLEAVQGNAQAAHDDAQIASNAATAAALSATQAETYAGAAAASAAQADLARDYAQDAQQSALAAQGSEDNARASELSAAISAESALQYKEDAETAASAAAGSAAQAATSVAAGGYIALTHEDEHLIIKLVNYDQISFAAEDERLIVYG